MASIQTKQHFTKYETARIIGARALQIAMDAPLLLTVSDEQLKLMKYDAIKIAELELNEGVLPITVHRPMPINRSEKLVEVKEEQVSDESLIAKAQEEEKEIVEDAAEIGLVNEGEVEEEPEETTTEEQ